MKPIILYLIQRDINRFGVLRRSMPKISKKVLTEQLRELENDDLIEGNVFEAKAELKKPYRNASVLTDKRVVFNIHGNTYRLIVDIEYRLKIVFVVCFGSMLNMIK